MYQDFPTHQFLTFFTANWCQAWEQVPWNSWQLRQKLTNSGYACAVGSPLCSHVSLVRVLCTVSWRKGLPSSGLEHSFISCMLVVLWCLQAREPPKCLITGNSGGSLPAFSDSLRTYKEGEDCPYCGSMVYSSGGLLNTIQISVGWHSCRITKDVGNVLSNYSVLIYVLLSGEERWRTQIPVGNSPN